MIIIFGLQIFCNQTADQMNFVTLGYFNKIMCVFTNPSL